MKHGSRETGEHGRKEAPSSSAWGPQAVINGHSSIPSADTESSQVTLVSQHKNLVSSSFSDMLPHTDTPRGQARLSLTSRAADRDKTWNRAISRQLAKSRNTKRAYGQVPRRRRTAIGAIQSYAVTQLRYIWMRLRAKPAGMLDTSSGVLSSASWTSHAAATTFFRVAPPSALEPPSFSALRLSPPSLGLGSQMHLQIVQPMLAQQHTHNVPATSPTLLNVDTTTLH